MGNITKFGALNAKLKVMSGGLLKEEELNSLLKAETLEEAVEYLISNTKYGEFLDGFAFNGGNLEDLEVTLKTKYSEEIGRLSNYMTDVYKRFFGVVQMRNEVENIKIMLRTLAQGDSLEKVRSQLTIQGRPGVEYDLLLQSRSVGEFIDSLKGTQYHRVISSYLNEPVEKLLFYMEMSLDRLYFESLKKSAKRLSNDEVQSLSGLIGVNIDLLNIQWIYRGFKFYGLTSEELINYTLGGGKNLTFDDLKRLCYAGSLDELTEQMKSTVYGSLFTVTENFDVDMEVSILRYLNKFFRNQKVKNPMNVVMTMVYMHEFEYEMRDVFSILEMKRYGIGWEEAKSFLVRVS